MRSAILHDNSKLDPLTDELTRVLVVDAHILVNGDIMARFSTNDDAETTLVKAGFMLDFRNAEGSTIWKAERSVRVEIQPQPYNENDQIRLARASDYLSIYPAPGISKGSPRNSTRPF